MAKYQRKVVDRFEDVLQFCEEAIQKGSYTVTLEETSDYEVNNTKVAIRAYERYSYFGNNRVSLHFTLVGANDEVYLTAISTGGSQATFFKINTWGEESFLDTLASAFEKKYK